MPLVDPIHKFVLFTNAKCGGTTLKTWFFDNLGIADLERRPLALARAFGPGYAARHLRKGRKLRALGEIELDDEAHPKFIDFYQRHLCAKFMSSPRVGDYFKIAVVRNPYDRVVSAYVDKFCGVDLRKPWVQEVVRAGGRDGALSFNQFLGYLEAVDEGYCNRHWRRQSYLLEDHHIDAFARIEALRADFEPLRTIVGDAAFRHFERKMQRVHYRSADEAHAEGDLADVSNSELIAWQESHGALPGKSHFLGPETIPRIRAIYRRDFEILPYDS